MAKYIIDGGKKLSGSVTVSGSKNAALPIICASLLTSDKTILKNIPDIADIRSMIKIISALGAKVSFENNVMEIDASRLKKMNMPEDLICKMRASILLIGPLLHRFKEVKMPFPGGCVLGKRSVSAHTRTLKELGCKILDQKEELHLKASSLKGKKIILPELSVTATENLLMASVLAQGVTEIRMAAIEPHVQDLCEFLKKMGAKIQGVGTNFLKVTGIRALKGCNHKISGDYLEAGTLAIAGVATKSEITVKGFNTTDLDALWQKFSEIGVKYELKKNSIKIYPRRGLKAVEMLRTAVFPSFPTDLQAPFAVLLTQAKGVSKIFETLFEGRLNYLFELEKMGARIEYLNPHQALIIGPKRLKAIPISSCDIRAGAAMVIAALMASGKTEISNIRYIDRGYEKFDEKLRSIGVWIERQNGDSKK
ncbi:UDP-N-acetylglucosamine 1-carboxyvinyltransferase [Candidatus Peregrinibacteria bacterium]|nr:UDP-N-acetylglucosamine 1-carboxyvinyltransferase [Candidatus Peregrinibacteria bacterium]